MESLAVPLVNSILGSYISNLETNQLSIGLWDGNVKLQNLKLKRDLFLKHKFINFLTVGKISFLIQVSRKSTERKDSPCHCLVSNRRDDNHNTLV